MTIVEHAETFFVNFAPLTRDCNLNNSLSISKLDCVYNYVFNQPLEFVLQRVCKKLYQKKAILDLYTHVPHNLVLLVAENHRKFIQGYIYYWC